MADNSIFSQDPYEIQQEQLNRRRRMAEAMMTASQQPLGAYPGAPVSALEGVGHLVQALVGAWQAKKADKGMQELATKRQGALTSDYQQLADLIANGTPTQVPTASGAYVPGMEDAASQQQPVPGMIGMTQGQAQPLPMRSVPQINPIYNGNGMDRGPHREATAAQIAGLGGSMQTPQMRDLALQYALSQKDKQFGRDIEQARLTDEQKRTEMMGKNYESEAAARQDTAKWHSGQVGAALAKAGFKMDEKTGLPVAMAESELSPQQLQDLADKKALAELRSAQKDLNEAKAEFEKTRSDPNSPSAQLAADKLRTTQVRLSILSERIGLSRDTFNARNLGLGPDGNPLPGAFATSDGTPVGSSFSKNVAPTGQMLGRGEFATSVDHIVPRMIEIVDKRPDIFGPLAGRKTDFNVWLGSTDPDAAQFKLDKTALSEHSGGMFGGMAKATIESIENAIGQNKTNPAALRRALQEAQNVSQVFKEQGTRKFARPSQGSPGAKIIKFDKSGNMMP